MNPPTSDKITVYQIYTRLFGNKNNTNKYYGTRDENGVGKFNDITDKALVELKKFGISHVWFTGVIEHATMTDYSAFGIAKDNPYVVKGIAGSPYAIKDYYDVNPDLAVDVKNRMKEFEALVARSHKAGLKVLIDCVPNHVARQYKSDAKPKGVRDFGEDDEVNQSFVPNNNFYYLPSQAFQVPDNVPLPPSVAPPSGYVENPAKATGNDVFAAKPSINDWFETIKLNYGVDYQNGRKKHFDPIPSTWLKMRDILTYWTQKGVDGFRCDMAEMVPVEFWGWVIPEIKKVNPAVVFIAEIYNPAEYRNYLFNGKFDYLYDKVGLYDALRRLMEGHGHAGDLTRVWQQESGDFGNRMLRFLENHDEQRIASKYFAKNPFYAIPSMVVSATMHTGPLMLYFGQEVGVNPTVAEGFSGEDGRTTMFDYWGVPEYQAWVNEGKFDGGKLSDEQKKLRGFYADLLQLVNTSDAIRHGAFYDLQYANINGQAQGYNDARMFTYLRHSDKQKLLIVCNFDLHYAAKTTLNIPAHAWETMGLSPQGNYQLKEIFYHPSDVMIEANKGLSLTMEANSVRIFEIQKVK
ncbi:MAG: alpha-amylase family protein [Spirosomaceae bacterium]|jgi:glycosidase|nr:alpha-amylase family protein [Spirosomataceae bacterium]